MSVNFKSKAEVSGITLVIWTKDPKSKVLSSLSPILRRIDAQVVVINDLSKVPDCNFVFALGGDTLAVCLEAGFNKADGKKVPKNATLTSVRNQLFEVNGCKVLFSYSAGIYERDSSMYTDLLCDTRTACRIALTGKYAPVLGHYEYVNDLSAVIADIKAQYEATGKPVDVAHDTETLGADPLRSETVVKHETKATKKKPAVVVEEVIPAARFITWQFSHRPGYSAVVYFDSQEDFWEKLNNGLYEQIKWLFTTPMVSMRLANGKYDLVWHWHHTKRPLEVPHMECTNFKFDTTLVGNLLDENRSNGLDVHAKIYTNLGGYSDLMDQTWDKSRMDLRYKENPQEFLQYAGGDTDATLQSSAAMKEELLKQPRLGKFYVHVLHPGARAFECIERGGVFLDMEAYRELECDLRTELDNLTKAAIKELGGILYARHKDDSKAGGINLTKASLLRDFLFSKEYCGIKPLEFTEKSQEPSTSLDHLLKFKDHPKAGAFIRLLEDYSGAAKALNTYVIGFQGFIRSDGRFHPSYYLHRGNRDEGEGGTVTGRLSCKDPAFQTIPKHTKWGKRLRRIFAAPPGYLMLERDYSQGELRVVACIANEQNMIQAYLSGMDLHVKTGGGIAGLTYEQMMELKKSDPKKFAEYRQQAKPANFGLLYGQQAPGFKLFAELNYGVIFTMEEAEEIRTKFFHTYPGLVGYHERMKAEAHKTGQVVSPLGNVRHLPLINSPNFAMRLKQERQAINSPVQSVLAYMMVWAAGIEWKYHYKDLMLAPSFGNIHDASYDYLPEDDWERHAKRKQEIMENLPFEEVGWKPQLKFPADCKVGKNMCDLKEVDLKAKAA